MMLCFSTFLEYQSLSSHLEAARMVGEEWEVLSQEGAAGDRELPHLHRSCPRLLA